jgi:ABC-2 type transport system ATP-binding protein
VSHQGLNIKNVTHRYGAQMALDDVSFSVGSGCFCALLGPNGAGKSTLFSLLTGLFSARQGSISIAGHDMAQTPRKALARMGVVFQGPSHDIDLTVLQNMRYYAALHGLSGSLADDMIEVALDRLGMRHRFGEKVGALNGGHRRRMELARALVHRPSVLLLDEPTAGLDIAMRRAITDHVHRLVSEDGLTVLWATHLVDEVAPSDHLVILHQGRIIADGTQYSVCEGATLSETYLRLTKSFVEDMS